MFRAKACRLHLLRTTAGNALPQNRSGWTLTGLRAEAQGTRDRVRPRPCVPAYTHQYCRDVPRATQVNAKSRTEVLANLILTLLIVSGVPKLPMTGGIWHSTNALGAWNPHTDFLLCLKGMRELLPGAIDIWQRSVAGPRLWS